MEKPHRVQLSRAKGWRMPENTVKVDRTTKYGNPFITGKHGTASDCVRLYRILAGGLLCLRSRDNLDAQVAARKAMKQARIELHGKNLACWCPLDRPCHADILLEVANRRLP